MKKTNIWNRMSGWLRAFLILALVFLVLGLGTLGSVTSTGDACALAYQQDDKGNYVGIVLNVNAPDEGHGEEGHVHRDLYVKEVYLNLGGIYTELGETVTLRIARATTAESSWYNYAEVQFANLYEKVEEGKNSVNPITDSLYNWVKYEVTTPDGWSVSTYSYYKISVTTPDSAVLLNEVVFVANDRDMSAEGEHKPVILNTALYRQATGSGSVLPFGDEAEAIIDSPCIPNLAQSSFFRFGQEEVWSMMTISEMRQGKTYTGGGIYHIDSVYNTLGNDLLAFGTLIGGMSPFGLRLMPFLASFGVLVFGYLFVKLIANSEKAGFIFALLYALCGMSMSLGHLGTPLMIGLFFFVAALYFTTKFFLEGLKEAGFVSAIPVMLAGLFAAASICVNGAFIIPVLGLVALFTAGLVRQVRTTRAALDLAIEEVEADENAGGTPHTEAGTSEPRKKLAAALAAHRFKGSAAGCSFFACLIMGNFLISVLAVLPMYFPYVKVLDNPANPSRNIFYFIWKAFSGGFVGQNYLALSQSAWNPFYLLFKGTGETFAVTATGSLIAIGALLSGVIGAVLAILLLMSKLDDESFKKELTFLLIPVVGLVLGLVTATFAGGSLAFQLLAYLCLFAIAAKAASEENEKYAKTIKGLSIFCLFALAVCFGLFSVFTFSIPTSGFLSGLWA